ncbi:MAG TPA: helix-turn-helix transcriptional regulator [Candidatus Limnocylindria bacterium]|nr:helix-turn-helix transcriptional regulator [Candidatus Limnocylindria bacterium]
MTDIQASTDPGLLLMISLAAGPKHGHAMLLDVERFAGIRLGPGTLYGALSRLEQSGQVEALPAEGRRRPYRLTGAGKTALEQRLGSLQRAVTTGIARVNA